MKMYTTPKQTAKLIELGFEKPKGWYVDGVTNNVKLYVNIDENPMMFNYSIGELIDMIPPIFTNKYKCDCYLNITHDSANWIIDYTVSGVKRPYIIVSEIEFIDALFSMILKLYETGFYDFETERYVY